MAAVIDIHTGLGIPPTPAASSQRPRRAALRVVHGGRSATGRHMRQTYRRRRLVALAAAVLILVVAVQLFGAAVSALSGPPTVAAEQVTATSHQVRPGDTLWAIASSVDPDGDPRDAVDDILRLNPGALSSSGVLRVGQVLTMPSA